MAMVRRSEFLPWLPPIGRKALFVNASTRRSSVITSAKFPSVNSVPRWT